MNLITVEVDEEKCIGCGSCAAVCPDNFEIENGKAKVKQKNPSKIGCNKEAESVCPVGAIKVTEE